MLLCPVVSHQECLCRGDSSRLLAVLCRCTIRRVRHILRKAKELHTDFLGIRLYQSCAILGATVMPHSLYLGSGIAQPRLLEYDLKNGNCPPADLDSDSNDKPHYQPSLPAMQYCLKYSITELVVTLFTFALFVNSAILIVSGSALSSTPGALSASLFSIHHLLSSSLAPAAGAIFAIALLLSGISAGIVCTIAGQMISEGALHWRLAPWLRRLITRSISIMPSIVIAGAVGKDGLTAALNATQVVLSVVLPFVAAPLIWFTSRNVYMTVSIGIASGRGTERGRETENVKLGNNWVTIGFAVLIWIVIAAMNVANLVLLGQGHT